MLGGKHVKVKKRRRQDILRFCADARKLMFVRVHRDPLDQLSVNRLIITKTFIKNCNYLIIKYLKVNFLKNHMVSKHTKGYADFMELNYFN